MKSPRATTIGRLPAGGYSRNRRQGFRIVVGKTFENGANEIGVRRSCGKRRIKRAWQSAITPVELLPLRNNNFPVKRFYRVIEPTAGVRQHEHQRQCARHPKSERTTVSKSTRFSLHQ